MATVSPSHNVSHQLDHHQERDNIILDFRAPPPSPIGSSRRASSVANDEVLTDFLENSLRVPDLILPDRIFPNQNPLREIPAVDFAVLNPDGNCSVLKIKESLAENGCFQVINHGISLKLIKSVSRRGSRIFRLSPEKKIMAVRSPRLPFGFEEMGGDQEEVISEMSEEFIWGRSYAFKSKMEGIWPVKYSKFSEKLENLALAVEKVAKDIMLILMNEISHNGPNFHEGSLDGKDNPYLQSKGSICHIYKHPHDVPVDRCISSLRHDVIRMMIRGSDYSHALSLHLCDGSSEFHVYSKKGWVSFTPLENALVVTVGDQIQAWSGGRYKHVIGKPIYASKNKNCTSMAFFYSPPPSNGRDYYCHKQENTRIISLREQAIIAIFFTIACQFLFHIYIGL